MTVYIVQEVPGRNVLSALVYGELECLLPPGMQVTLSSQPVVRRLKKALRNFNDSDYILLMGDPVAIGITCSVAAIINNGRYRLLKWDREQRIYYVLQLDLSEKYNEPTSVDT